MGDSSDQELCYSLRWARGRVEEGRCSGSLFPLRRKTSMLGVYQNLHMDVYSSFNRNC